MKRIFLNYLDKTVEASYKASALEMGYKLFIPIMLLIFFDIGTYAFPGVLATNNSNHNRSSHSFSSLGFMFKKMHHNFEILLCDNFISLYDNCSRSFVHSSLLY